MIKKQFTLYLENKPGMLARVTTKLAAKKVNIEGISVAASTDVGLVQIVASDSEATEKVLNDLNIAFTAQDVALVCLRNEPGALSEGAAKLAEHGVNINYIYATGCNCSREPHCQCYAIISAPDLEKVEAAWNEQ